MQRLPLPDGQWADLRTPELVPERLRRPVVKLQTQLAGRSSVLKAIEDSGDGALDDPATSGKVAADLGEALDLMNELNDLVVVAMVAGWSYEAPVSVDSLLDLPGGAYDALRRKCAPHLKDLTPDFTPDGAADPASPTEPSGA